MAQANTTGRLRIHGLGLDVRYAMRRFKQHPLLTTVVLATLALGIGSSAAIFTLVDGVLLRPLPFPDDDRLALVWQKDRRHPELTAVSPPNFYDWRDATAAFESLAAYGTFSVNLSGTGEPERVPGSRVTASFFEVLGVAAELGRSLQAADFDPVPAAVAVLSHGLWQRRFGGHDSVLGQTVEVNGEPHTIVGVMPPGFGFPERRTAIWRPSTLPRDQEDEAGSPYRAFRVLYVVGRLADGVSVAQARAEFRSLAAQLEEAYPESNHDQEAVVVTPRRSRRRRRAAGAAGARSRRRSGAAPGLCQRRPPVAGPGFGA